MSDLLGAYEIVKAERATADPTDDWLIITLDEAFDALDALTYDERMKAHGAKLLQEMDDEDAPDCPNCARGEWTCRVMGGSYEGAHESTYACDECAAEHALRIGKDFLNVTVTKLGSA